MIPGLRTELSCGVPRPCSHGDVGPTTDALSALPFLIAEPRTLPAVPQCPLSPALAGTHGHGHGALGQNRNQFAHTWAFSSPILPPLLLTLDNSENQRICISACSACSSELWRGHPAEPTAHSRPGAGAGICLLPSARSVYLESFRLLLSCTLARCSAAPAASSAPTALLSICLCSPGAASFPRTPFPLQLSAGHWPFAAQIPSQGFVLLFSSTSQCLSLCCCEELVLYPTPSSLPKPSLRLCYSRRRESRDFEILPDGEGPGGARLYKTQIWK